MSEPAYTRLQVAERRAQLIAAGAALFAEHAFEEISMRQIAEAAGISKPLLYHYFPSKIELFKAAVAEQATELQGLIEPSGEGTPRVQSPLFQPPSGTEAGSEAEPAPAPRTRKSARAEKK